MTRNSAKLLLLFAATVFFSSAFPNPSPAQTVSFITRVDYAAGTNPSSVAVGDFNRDGVPDVAVANYGSNTVSVLLGNGVGIFKPTGTLAAGANPEFVAVSDFNRDGVPDLVVACSGSNSVWCFWATAMAPSSRHGTSPRTVVNPWPWATSMAMGCKTWRWPTIISTTFRAPTRSPCCWATAVAPSSRLGPSRRLA